MAKISFSKEFKRTKNERLDKLTLDYNERARVALIGELDANFTHNLTKIMLDEDTGLPITEKRTNQRGSEYEVNVNEFVGRFKCTGKFDVVNDRGTDEDNCPFCKAAVESGAFEKPRRYMVSLVFQYEVKPNSSTPMIKPFQGKVLPWVFTDGKWDKIADLDEEYAEDGGVYAKDLILGPCESKSFQNYDIAIARECTYKQDPVREQYVAELMEAYEGDLSTLFGREVTAVEAERYIREVQNVYDAGMNPRGRKPDQLSSSSSEAVDALFGDDPNEYAPEDDTEEESSDDKDASGVKNIEDLINF